MKRETSRGRPVRAGASEFEKQTVVSETDYISSGEGHGFAAYLNGSGPSLQLCRMIHTQRFYAQLAAVAENAALVFHNIRIINTDRIVGASPDQDTVRDRQEFSWSL